MIPKILHMIWVGPKPFPYQENLQRYRDLNPDWEIKLWTDGNLPDLKNLKIYKTIPIYATKADLLRIELLAKYGGVYVDADSYPLKPIDGMIEDVNCMFVTTNSKGRIEINCMGCEINSPEMNSLVDGFKKYWQRLGKKESEHDCYCVYRYIKRRVKKMKHMKLERIYNCTAEEAAEATYIIQQMANTWEDSKRFRRA